MKKFIFFLQALMISFIGMSQQELFDNDWLLHYMVIDGETINIPQFVTPRILFNNPSTGFDVWATVDDFNYFAEFAPPTIFTQNNFLVHEGSVTLGDCTYCELENQYLGTILLGLEREFDYEIIDESNGNKILIITTPEGNTAVHGNYLLSSGEFEKENIKVYPNPTKNLLYIDSKELIVEEIIVFSLLGTNVFETRDLNQNSSIDMSFLKSGIYYAQIIFENGNNYVFEFIKE